MAGFDKPTVLLFHLAKAKSLGGLHCAFSYHGMKTLGRVVHMSNVQRCAVCLLFSVAFGHAQGKVDHAVVCLFVKLLERLVLSSSVDDHSYDGGKFVCTMNTFRQQQKV